MGSKFYWSSKGCSSKKHLLDGYYVPHNTVSTTDISINTEKDTIH